MMIKFCKIYFSVAFKGVLAVNDQNFTSIYLLNKKIPTFIEVILTSL